MVQYIMRCSLCPLVYQTIDECGRCEGCAEDMVQAEIILQAVNTQRKTGHARSDRETAGLKEPCEESILPLSGYELGRAGFMPTRCFAKQMQYTCKEYTCKGISELGGEDG